MIKTQWSNAEKKEQDYETCGWEYKSRGGQKTSLLKMTNGQKRRWQAKKHFDYTALLEVTMKGCAAGGVVTLVKICKRKGFPTLEEVCWRKGKAEPQNADIFCPISCRELLLNHNLLRVLPYELGRLFQLQTLGLKGEYFLSWLLLFWTKNSKMYFKLALY